MRQTILSAQDFIGLPILRILHKTLYAVIWRRQYLLVLLLNWSKDMLKYLSCSKQSPVTQAQTLERKTERRPHHCHWREDPPLCHAHANMTRRRKPRRRKKPRLLLERYARSAVLASVVRKTIKPTVTIKVLKVSMCYDRNTFTLLWN